LGRLRDGHLHALAQRTHQPAHMRRVLRHTTQLPDDRGDPFGRPALTDDPKGWRALRKCIDQLCPLLRSQTRSGTRSRTSSQRVETTVSTTFDPLTDSPLRHAHGRRNVFLLPALFVQFPGTLPSSFAPINR
jgi:hypothetical protein